MTAVLLAPEQRWVCPNCTATAVTHRVPRAGVGAAEYHRCPGLGGLNAPMVADGVRARVVAVEREDYVGKERVQTDASGRPVMAIRTVRDDGYDTDVLAPMALGRRKDFV